MQVAIGRTMAARRWNLVLTGLVLISWMVVPAHAEDAAAHAAPAGHAEVSQEKDVHAADPHAAGGHAGGSHGEHDPYDLTHANAGHDLADPAAFPKADLALATLIVFVLLLLVLRKFAWGPIMDALHQREHYVENQLEQARLSNEQAQRLLAEHQQKLAQAHEEVRQMLEQARKDAETHKQQVMAEADAAVQSQKVRAVQAIDAAKNAALTQLAETSVNTAVGLAGKIVRRQLTRDEHADLVRDALDKFPARN